MSPPVALRCSMKMLFCGLFWHTVIVSLKFPFVDAPHRGVLTISRPKLFGGKLEITLNCTVRIIPMTGKQVRRFQLGIRYGSWRERVILRAPNSAIYETWWAAIETALAQPTYLPLPFAGPPIRPEDLVSIIYPKTKTVRFGGAIFQDAELQYGLDEYAMLDEVPLLDTSGPLSSTDVDILASWQTSGSLDYFATRPAADTPLTTQEVSEDGYENDNNSCNTRGSVYSDISEFWTRTTDVEDEVPHDAPAAIESSVEKMDSLKQPQDADEVWLDEIARFAFRQKVGAARKSELRPKRPMAGQIRSNRGFSLFQRRAPVRPKQAA